MSKQYYLLMRNWSSYCSNSIYIGVYDNIEKVEEDRIKYINYIDNLDKEEKDKDEKRIKMRKG